MDIPTKGSMKIIVKANQRKNEITGYNEEKEAFLVSIKEPAENGKANSEIIKFLRKITKKEVKILKRKTSKQKVIHIA